MKRSMMTTADVQRHLIGAAITLLTNRSVWFSGYRQLVFAWRPDSPPSGWSAHRCVHRENPTMRAEQVTGPIAYHGEGPVWS
jgi:hypothetical protein